MPHGGVLQPDPSVVQPSQARGHVARNGWKSVKLGRSPGWNPVQAERSRYCIYAFVHKPAVDPGSKQRDLHGDIVGICGKRIPVVFSICQADEYSRSSDTVMMDLDPECRRGYWKQRDPDLWF
ncbi:unnamed protein product [Phytophthora fragariaefolia]|uniref:Unnamed protein product n=1 Tax=Phytophthora fragariaefolia TaxID=1490495 RepID=A0A9W7D147_9STRA|nr:unnamed protein product [Phytophthora fragariaefolia]